MHVVITGAAGRLGAYLVKDFASGDVRVSAIVRREDDADNVLHGLQSENVDVFAADLTDEDSTRDVFDLLHKRHGAPDVVIHAVGTWSLTPLLDTSAERWRGVVDTNLTSTFLCFKHAIRVMGDRGGRLIAFASGQGADRGQAQQSTYSSAKAGVVSFVQSVDAEFRSAGIYSFSIAPSFILYDGHSEEAGVRAGDLSALCRFLCTDAAISLSGTVIRAYGDRR